MQILSAYPHPIHVKVQGRPPTIVGRDETRWPAPTVTIPPRSCTEVTDAQGVAILSLHGRRGVAAVGYQTHDQAIIPNDTVEAALHRALETRLEYLRSFLNNFRAQNELLRAQNAAIIMPGRRQRDALREMKALMKEVGDDELLSGTGEPVQAATVRANELAALGLDPVSTPAAAGGFAGVDGI